MKRLNYSMLTMGVFLVFNTIRAQSPLMRDFIGVNVKPHLPSERMTQIGFTRNFHLWSDDQGSGGGATGMSF